MKIKNYVFIVLFIALIMGIGVVTRKEYVSSNQLSVDIEKVITVNLGDKIYNVDAIKKIVHGNVISKKELLETNVVGKKSIKLVIEDLFDKQKEYVFDLIVVDNIAPEITFKDKLSVEEGNKIDLLKDVSAKDNYDKEVEVKVEGEYDLNKPDTYKLYYVAKDSSGNETKEEVELKVTKKVVVVEKKPEVKVETNNNTTTNNEKPQEKTPEVVTNPDGSFTTSKGFHGVTKNGITYIDGVLIANKTYSVPRSYAPGGLTSETQNAFNIMRNAASQEGISLWVASGYRSYDHQNRLWTNRKNKYGIKFADAGTARPGHSEHQTGLGMDINMVDDAFENTKAGQWLFANAYKYGFILRYPKGKTSETGYKYESWHYRYVGVDLATKLYNGGNWITLENYFGITSQYNY